MRSRSHREINEQGHTTYSITSRSRLRSYSRYQPHIDVIPGSDPTSINSRNPMPKKRPHHKSRFGCDQCRKRRVKCDESAPICMICRERGDLCVFSRVPGQKQEWSSSELLIPDSSIALSGSIIASGYFFWSPNIVQLPTLPPLKKQSPISETALMHHWCTQTCHSFTRQGSEIFREHVGKEALKHKYLLHAVFAITLLHLASSLTDPAAIRDLVHAALQHQNESVNGLRKNLADIDPANCDAIFACSVLVMVCAIMSPLLSTQDSETTPETILLLTELMNGVSTIVGLTRHWIERGPLHKFFGIVEPHFSFQDEWTPVTHMRHLLHATAQADYTSHTNDRQILENAINGLNKVWNREICAVFWIVQVDQGFVEEVRRGERFAMLAFMHWGVLLSRMDEMWWKKYAGKKLVQQVARTLVGFGGEWERMARWCRGEVE